MRIGELAKAAGVNIQTIRYYERIGLLHPDGRSSVGYRWYESGAVTFLRHVKHAQRLGFTLAELKQLFEPHGQANAAEQLRRLADTKLLQLTHRIETLQNMQSEIRQLLEGCGCNRDASCEVARAFLMSRA